jgi:hypothetical protein
MAEEDVRTAAHDRDAGLAKVTAISWRAGAAGVAAAGLLTVALGQHAAAATSAPRQRNDQGAIVIPAQPPKPTAGAGQVTSGAS